MTTLADIQRHLGVPADGVIGPVTIAAIARALGLERRRINAAGRALIREFEGCALTAYPDPASGGAPWTIGYGHTGPDVAPGKTIDQAEADALLDADLARCEAAVAAAAPEAGDNQFAALVSLAFNIGAGALRKSTLLRLHNAGDHAGAQAQFARWIYASGKPLYGLERRRRAEAALYGRRA